MDDIAGFVGRLSDYFLGQLSARRRSKGSVHLSVLYGPTAHLDRTLDPIFLMHEFNRRRAGLTQIRP